MWTPLVAGINKSCTYAVPTQTQQSHNSSGQWSLLTLHALLCRATGMWQRTAHPVQADRKHSQQQSPINLYALPSLVADMWQLQTACPCVEAMQRAPSRASQQSPAEPLSVFVCCHHPMPACGGNK